MKQFIGCDAHKLFSVFVAVNEKGQAGDAIRDKSTGTSSPDYQHNQTSP